jgi:RNA polymerase sigma-70 factor, ECF subfamily
MSLLKSDETPLSDDPARIPDLDALYRAHAATVGHWIARLAGPNADVEDLVHETFLVARKKLPKFRGEAKVTTWLYRIAERVVLEQRRRDRFRRWLSSNRQLEIEGMLAPPRLTPVDELEQRQWREAVYRILDRMPDKYRTALILFELEEMSGEEISALTGVKLATVWVHLHRGRDRFLADMKRFMGRQR